MKNKESDRKTEIGIFSGSFNPIHMGHMMLANYMCEFSYLDEVWLVVTPQNPLKKSIGMIEDEMRLMMARLAVSKQKNIKVSDVEFHMPRPSYTIDTFTKLTNDHPDKKFSLIIGADNWSIFNNWKDYEKLMSLYRILIYPRQNYELVIPDFLNEHVQQVDAPIIEVSSTFIRDSIRGGKDLRSFVPDEVYDYIEKYQLYKTD